MCLKRWIRVGDSQSKGRTFHTEETVWAEDRVEVQQLAYVCVHRYVWCTCRGQSQELALER